METIKSEVTLLAPLKKVWESFTEPKHVTKWFFALQHWRCPKASNDLREGGNFNYRMEAKDGSFAYDFAGTIHQLDNFTKIEASLSDGRKAEFIFSPVDDTTTKFAMIFEPETRNTRESQKRFWDVVLTNFEKYVENNH